MDLKVKIIDYGFSDSLKRYYVTYQVTGLESNDLSKLSQRLSDPHTVQGMNSISTSTLRKDIILLELMIRKNVWKII